MNSYVTNQKLTDQILYVKFFENKLNISIEMFKSGKGVKKIINYSPKVTMINEKKIFKRKNDDDSKFNLEYLEDRLSENKISKVQSLSDLTKIKIIIHSITEKIGTMPLGIGNNSYLFQENGEIKIKKRVKK